MKHITRLCVSQVIEKNMEVSAFGQHKSSELEKKGNSPPKIPQSQKNSFQALPWPHSNLWMKKIPIQEVIEIKSLYCIVSNAYTKTHLRAQIRFVHVLAIS